MTRLQWDAPGERLFEVGVDRGVLYVDGYGVPWNGLISVQEKSSGGDFKPHFQDGVMYAVSISPENFEATIEAFTSPPEFDACDGSLEFAPGLYATAQQHKTFGLCYRTIEGNDIDGIDRGYKLHLVYNAFVGISEKDYQSLSDEVDPMHLSWPIMALPEMVPGIRPTAHFIVNSVEVDPLRLANLEAALYGTDAESPYLPPLQDVADILQDPDIFTITDHEDGSFSATGPDDWFTEIDEETWDIDAPSVEFIDADSYYISSVGGG